jgi:membrane protease YdiL (CAAX protease family)
VLNATLEELLFRGLLWGAVADEWNDRIALAATSLLFGALHLHGYPPGPLGVILAGLYAIGLGLLRTWTGGLGLAVACHICADATIFGLLARAGAFDA